MDFGDGLYRCKWVKSEVMRKYHDEEWCKPLHSEEEYFELMTLEGAHAGLSWELILKKRDKYKKAFFNFDISKCANLTDAELEDIKENSGIIPNKRKVYSVRNNAQRFLEIQEEFRTFEDYIYTFTGGEVDEHIIMAPEDIPAESDLSKKISKDLKKRGFQFLGPIIVYSYLQAMGMVNDHELECHFR